MSKTESTLEELVGMIECGELRLPEMQRRHVRRTRVHALRDSLYRGYSLFVSRPCLTFVTGGWQEGQA